mgnify:CR=1 FL=1
MKILDVGCGANKTEGAIGLDNNPRTNADVIHDLGELPYTFPDNEFELVVSNHVVEHVPDVKSFLEKIDSMNAGDIILTVPDAVQCARRHFEYQEQGEEFIEIVHPDHNCWYTPYTIKNTITKYTSWKIDGLWFFNNISILAVINKQR